MDRRFLRAGTSGGSQRQMDSALYALQLDYQLK